MHRPNPNKLARHARHLAARARSISLPASFPRTKQLVGRASSLAWAGVQWVPVTPLGGLAAAGLYFGLQTKHTDRVLLGIELAGLGLLALCVATVLTTALLLRLRREPVPTVPLRFETDIAFRTGYRLGRLARNPLVRVEVKWQRPPGAHVEMILEHGELLEVVTARQRGTAAELVRRLVVSDVFGLARVRFCRRMPVELTIKPQCGRANPRQLLRQQASGEQLSHPDGKPEGDLIEMRRYAAGDAMKLVLWKLYARSGQLLVRQPERTIAVTRKMLLHFVSGSGDEPAAGICRAVLEGCAAGSDLLLGTDLDEPAARNAALAVDQLVRSASAARQGGSGLTRTLAAGAQQGSRACVLFVPPKPGAWLDRVVVSLAACRGQRRAIVGVDRLVAVDPQQGWSRWLIDGQDAAGYTAVQLQETCRRLSEAGAEVFIVERVSGSQQRAADLRPAPTNPKKLARSGASSC